MSQMKPHLIIDRYQIEKKLGHGGFGETFIAKDTRMPTNRKVVVKKLKPINKVNVNYQVIKDSFKKEAAILEEIGRNHPNIPELYDYFENKGEFYIVQEYVEGKTLNKISPITQEQAFSILSSLLRTLEYLQDKNLIHRDIKPENIIIRHGDGLPVLIDFGAVKDSMGKVQRSSGSIMSSVVIGTRGFMAPEQNEGSPIFSSDLYSLARTMIFALTNKLPNEIEKDMITGKLNWEKYLPTLDQTLAHVLNKASQLSPERRYPTAEEMYRDLHSSESRELKREGKPYSQSLSEKKTVRVAGNFDTSNVSPIPNSYSSQPKSKESNNKIIYILLLIFLFVPGISIGSYLTNRVLTEQRLAEQIREEERLAEQRRKDEEEQRRKDEEEQRRKDEEERLAKLQRDVDLRDAEIRRKEEDINRKEADRIAKIKRDEKERNRNIVGTWKTDMQCSYSGTDTSSSETLTLLSNGKSTSQGTFTMSGQIDPVTKMTISWNYLSSGTWKLEDDRLFGTITDLKSEINSLVIDEQSISPDSLNPDQLNALPKLEDILPKGLSSELEIIEFTKSVITVRPIGSPCSKNYRYTKLY